MMHNWNQLTNDERNLLIARDDLEFDCFQTEGGIRWYEKHYALGQWRYSTRLSDAIDLSERMLQAFPVRIQIDFLKGKYACLVLKLEAANHSPLFETEGATLPEVICQAALYLKEVPVN